MGCLDDFLTFALVAIGRRCGVVRRKVVRCRGRDGVDEGLQGLFVHVRFLLKSLKINFSSHFQPNLNFSPNPHRSASVAEWLMSGPRFFSSPPLSEEEESCLRLEHCRNERENS
jgi:hypothetical protein